MRRVRYAAAFKQDFKAMVRRGNDPDDLEVVLSLLMRGQPLPERCKDHPLAGNWSGYRECHIRPDWLLIYTIGEDGRMLTLVRTGSHSDLF